MIQLNISQQPAKLELNISDPKLNIKTTPPKILMTTEPAVVEINRTDGKLEIDQYPCRYSIGFKNSFDLLHDAAQEGRQAALEGVGRIAAEGDRLARVESKEDAIVNIASETTIKEPYEITWARIASPNLHYEPGKVEFNPIYGKLNLDLERGTVDLELQRGEVKGRITQYQNVRFWTSQSNLDLWA
ncbi:DUF6470 family protein [Dendrosporobacter sp. 1207_IL3150]|uniref:DUF6470 family protein n=1 Tax=Dendrosporobacter sp. 1207_IL3150 TaxID=3084054 RepID=UPI002FDA7393